MQGSIFFGFGFFLVLIGWPVLGMLVESYGFITLFRLVVSFLLFLHDLLLPGSCFSVSIVK